MVESSIVSESHSQKALTEAPSPGLFQGRIVSKSALRGVCALQSDYPAEEDL